MNTNSHYRGVWPVMLTPFDEQREIGPVEVERFRLELHAGGVSPVGDADDDGVVVAGDFEGLGVIGKFHRAALGSYEPLGRCAHLVSGVC